MTHQALPRLIHSNLSGRRLVTSTGRRLAPSVVTELATIRELTSSVYTVP